MIANELEIEFIEICERQNLKQQATDLLGKIIADPSNNDTISYLRGYDIREIKCVFDGFRLHTLDRFLGTRILTRIGLYIENKIWVGNLEPIGYYELETNMDGEILDDYFVMEKEKHSPDFIIDLIQNLNTILPIEYLKRNHIHYQYICYISLIGTLFISKKFEGVGIFVRRAYHYIDAIDTGKVNTEYLKESKRFLKTVKSYIIANNLISEEVKKELSKPTP